MRCSGVSPPAPIRLAGRQAIIPGVENDHATHSIGVNLGECCFGQWFGIVQHRPVEHWIKCDFVIGDVNGQWRSVIRPCVLRARVPGR